MRAVLMAETCVCAALLPWVAWRLVYVGEIHAVGELQAGYLARVELDFQVSLQDGNVDRFALCRALALGANAIQLHIAVMGFDEFVDDGVHGDCILPAREGFTNRSKTLEVCLVSSRQVTLLQSHYLCISSGQGQIGMCYG
jgi:hypothetical protein